MTVTGAIVLFAVIWFVALLVALPIGVTTQEEAGEITPGMSICRRSNRRGSSPGGMRSATSSINGVSTPAGHTQLTRTPSSASSTASARVSSTRPPFEAQ